MSKSVEKRLEKQMTCVTHFNACDCREEKFKRLEMKNEEYRAINRKFLEILREERILWGL